MAYNYQQTNNNYAHYSPQPSEFNYQSNWDTESYRSGSQAHLVPQYETVPTVPSIPYPQANYPPGSRPMIREQSGGYSVVRDNLMKRRSIRQVELYQGNLSFDVPVPTHIVPKHLADLEEMSTMRYTAATCDPDDFVRSRYTLRQSTYGRQTELFIVMTMYNEDEILFLKTMNACVPFDPPFAPLYSDRSPDRVIKNIGHLCGRSRSKTWGSDGWKKVVVCIVSDGRSKVDKRTLQVLTLVRTYYNRPFTILFNNLSLDGLLPGRYCKGFCRRQGCDCPHLRVRFGPLFFLLVIMLNQISQVHFQCHGHRKGRSIARIMSRSDSVLFKGTEQEKTEQSSMVL
jgi:hypothetical protein